MSTLDNLRREAKGWLKALRQGQASAWTRLRTAYPAAPAAPGLRDVQHALAREHGFENWRAFKIAIARRASTAASTRDPPHPTHAAASGGAGRLEAFLSLACWDHHTHGISAYQSNASAAMRLLARHPEIAQQDLFTAIVCGELARVERILAGDPDLAKRKGGARGWEPLLYLCYARLPLAALDEYAVRIARVLLDAGADPNAFYMAGDASYSALVGVAGEGEQDAPRAQPYKASLYTLLQRGAGPYDSDCRQRHEAGDHHSRQRQKLAKGPADVIVEPTKPGAPSVAGRVHAADALHLAARGASAIAGTSCRSWLGTVPAGLTFLCALLWRRPSR